MSKDQFQAKYEVDDGYVGGSRPQSFTIRADDYDFEGMTDEQIEELFYEAVEEEMRQRISACKMNVSEFVAWARSLPSGMRNP